MNAPPEKRRIALSSLAALVLATLLLVTLVLPAEYGWDPLGTGAALGLTNLAGSDAAPLRRQDTLWRQDTIEFQLAPFEGVEYKYRLAAGATLFYHWQSQQEVVFDMHAEPDGAAPGFAQSFEKSRGKQRTGSYSAPFSGIHGWFWQNRTQNNVTVRLQTTGFFKASQEMRGGRVFHYEFPKTAQP